MFYVTEVNVGFEGKVKDLFFAPLQSSWFSQFIMTLQEDGFYMLDYSSGVKT